MEKIRYRPQLDALRAAAVSSVLVEHLLTPFGGAAHHGVRLFFVISGFLITSILLTQRDSLQEPFWSKIRTFYIRRSIRIWPIYYLVLVGVAALNIENIRASLVWHLGYVSNFYYMKVGQWSPMMTTHLWSLSVEEQFYLLWPFAILLTPRRWLIWTIGAAIFSAAVYRWAVSSVALAFPDLATPAAFDALGIGALLAFAKHTGTSYQLLRRYLWLSSALSVVAIMALEIGIAPSLDFAVRDLLFAIIFGAIVAAADVGVNGPLQIVLEWPPVLFLGRISYGVYLYHLFVTYIVWVALSRLGWRIPRYGPEMFAIVVPLTITAASISWFAIERPLARWKERFSYARRTGYAPKVAVCSEADPA